MGGNSQQLKAAFSAQYQESQPTRNFVRARMLSRVFPLRSRLSRGVGAVQPEKRRHQRIHIALPVFLKDATGVTRDVSASGMFFWTSGAWAAGDLIGFVVELNRRTGRMMLKCNGDVIRTELRDALIGVAVRIKDSNMEIGADQV